MRCVSDEYLAEVSAAVEHLFPTYLRQPGSLTPMQQAVLDTWVLSGVVGNGGFDAWVRSNGHRAKQTIEGLRLLGQGAVADVVTTAITITGALEDRTAGDAAIDGLSEEDYARLDGLSEKVWEADAALEQAMIQALHDSAWGR
jgi:hypothetical protein